MSSIDWRHDNKADVLHKPHPVLGNKPKPNNNLSKHQLTFVAT